MPLDAGLEKADQRSLKCVVLRMRVDKGVLTSEGFVLLTPKMSVSGTGFVDLDRERMDMLFAADPKAPVLEFLEKPVRISGPLQDLEVEFSVPQGVASKVVGLIFSPVAAAGYLLKIWGGSEDELTCLKLRGAGSP